MKTGKRLLPSSKYDIPALEAWFSTQSKKGLFLQSVGIFFADFQEGSPQRKTYRLEVNNGLDALPEKEMIETYAAFGWEYVTCISNFFHVYAHEGDAELHSDPLVQSLTLEKTEKRLKSNLKTACVLPIFPLISYAKLTRSGGITLIDIVRYDLFLFLVALFLVYLLFFLQSLLPYLQIRRQRKALQSGSFPERSAKVRRLHSGYCGVGLLLCLIFLLIYSVTGLQTYVSAEEELRHWQKTPFVTLEEIEGLPPKDYAAMTQEEYLDFDNFTYFEEHSLLDPHQFILRQDTRIPVEEGENHSTYRLTAYLGMQYDAVAFSFLAEPFYRAQIREELPEDAVEISVTVEGVDACDLFCSQKESYLFMRKGKKNLFVNHCGKGDLLPYLERFAALLQEDSRKVYPLL